MSSDLLKEIAGADEFQQSLGQIRDGRQDYEEFFDDALRRLEATLNEAVKEQQAWEEQRANAQSELDEQAADIESRRQQLETQRDNFLNEALAAAENKFQMRFEEIAERFSGAAAAAVTESESRIQQMLDEASNERRAIGEALATSGPDESQIAKLREERDEIMHSRSMLEAELETLRGRMAELMGTLEEQKKSAAERQSQWGDELHRQRQMLELLLQKTSELESFAAAAKAKESVAAADGNTALSSVLSQFEVLQKDIARRRNAAGN